MLDDLSKKQKRILAIARNVGSVTMQNFNTIYSKHEFARRYLEKLINMRILVRDRTPGLFLYNKNMDDLVLQALCQTSEKQKIFKEILPWVK